MEYEEDEDEESSTLGLNSLYSAHLGRKYICTVPAKGKFRSDTCNNQGAEAYCNVSVTSHFCTHVCLPVSGF